MYMYFTIGCLMFAHVLNMYSWGVQMYCEDLKTVPIDERSFPLWSELQQVTQQSKPHDQKGVY